MNTQNIIRMALEALEKVKHGQWEEDSREGRALITALRDALEQQEHKPELRELLIAAAAIAVAAERRGAYQGASWVADVLLQVFDVGGLRGVR